MSQRPARLGDGLNRVRERLEPIALLFGAICGKTQQELAGGIGASSVSKHGDEASTIECRELGGARHERTFGFSPAARGGQHVMALEPSFRDAMLEEVPKLRAFAMSLCRNSDQADNLVQETLLRACAGIGLFKPGTNMAAWLFTILRNAFYSECRWRRRIVESFDDHVETLVGGTSQADRADLGDLVVAMGKLRSEVREALILIAAAGFSYREAARICGCPEGTIKSRVNRGRARLAQLLRIEDAGTPKSMSSHALEAGDDDPADVLRS